MNNQFMFLPVMLMNQQTVTIIRDCNDYTSRFGLKLSEQEILELVENRKMVLEETGRIEFGGGIIQKLIMEFADSVYVNQQDYVEILNELQECFYYFKKESLEEISDDELIGLMKLYYDEVCHGSIEFLRSSMLENYCRDIRYRTKDYQKVNGYEDDYTDFLDWDEKKY
ncbi:MAG: hypothetical protein K0R46_5 [Herbinix sp.]|jgi:hypothetical protein|nr:hypothetical protein [Herbinix sp.]